jgi:hypothetical protein
VIHLQGIGYLVDPGAHLSMIREREQPAEDDAQEQ